MRVEIGPLSKGKCVYMKICGFDKSDNDNDNDWVELQREKQNGEVWYVCKRMVNMVVQSDIKVCVSGSVNFYVWVNLWHATLEMVEKWNCDEEEEKENDVSKNISNWSGRKMEEVEEKDKEEEKKSIPLYEVMFKLKGNMNLNPIVNEVNLGLVRKVDKRKLMISLGAEQLDKFEEKKKIKNIKLNIYYKLLE